MSILGIDVLSFLIVAPAVIGLLLMVLPQSRLLSRVIALSGALFVGAVSVVVFFAYQTNATLGQDQFLFVVKVPWFQLIDASWHVGVDGISVAGRISTPPPRLASPVTASRSDAAFRKSAPKTSRLRDLPT